ncbi:TraV family lipoprotein [Thiothrix lacustris]|jgi:conjugal transfer pilus assembly protein TraV|uniref:TraV family lipoprotein n=1 Tax=Thiothrix lacustris TaxID=525917 RepID=UPI0027E577AC|nr:TraV family lipoprotein [Thiothrix lacustris]WMP17317.1 TraV family lipoprotein [Thiothrix lacustris]
MKMKKTGIGMMVVVAATVLLSGCSTSPTYSCGSPQGGKCQSVTDSYLSALGKKLKGIASPAAGSDGTSGKAVEASARVTQYIPEGVAIRSSPQVLRVWVAPWEDNNRVFHDQSYNYFVADSGEWMLRANTEKSLYANGYRALARPTEKQPVASGDTPAQPAKPAMTTAEATAAALDFAAGN